MFTLDTSAPHVPAPEDVPADERRILYEIIRTVSSSVDLERVLDAIVHLVTERTRAHATMVFIVEGPRENLVMRAVSDERYRDQVGRASMAIGEGLAGWVAAHRQPVFIAEDALSDPRVKYFPEFEEEKYQSIVSVPLITPDERVIGVIALHAEAPRVFTADDAAFVTHSASLVAAAIANARLYEAARHRVRELERLSSLSSDVSAAASLEQLLPSAADKARSLLHADAIHLYLMERGDRLLHHASLPTESEAPVATIVADLGELRRQGLTAAAAHNALVRALGEFAIGSDTLLTPMIADGDLVGAMVAHSAGGRPFDEDDLDLAASISAQLAVGIKKIRLIEGLEERNLIKDFFADLTAGRTADGVAGRARRLGCDFSVPRAALVATGERDAGEDAVAQSLDRFQHALTRAVPGVLIDLGDVELVALVPLIGMDERDLAQRLEKALGDRDQRLPLVVGISSPAVGAEAVTVALDEARQAATAGPVVRGGPAVITYDDLGPYAYLLRIPRGGTTRDRRRDALRRLREYDEQRQAQLTRTLEEYLRRRGNISATAQALYLHPNTLRQRLRRIEELSGIDVKRDDWLTIEIGLKLLRLEEALGR